MLDSAIARELQEKALRSSMWLAVYHSQQLGKHELCGQLTALLVGVDEQRELHASGERRGPAGFLPAALHDGDRVDA